MMMPVRIFSYTFYIIYINIIARCRHDTHFVRIINHQKHFCHQCAGVFVTCSFIHKWRPSVYF